MKFDYSTLPSLSATITEFDAVLETLSNQLTSLHVTPHEIQKRMLFKKDHKFPTINDIEIPKDITTEGLIDAINDLEKSHQKVVIDSTVNPDKYNIIDSENEISILAELSGDNTFLVTGKKFKDYIEYTELVRSIDIGSVTPDNCHDIIRKLGYFYVKTMTQKTV
jgi:hypothetical protein